MVLLLNVADPWLRCGGDRPSLGTLYIAAYAEQCGLPIDVMDLNHHNDQELLSRLQINPTPLVGVSMTTPQYREGKRIAYLIKKHFPNTTLVAGGSHPTSLRGDVDPIFDFVCLGEGERSFVELAKGEYKNVYERIVPSNPIPQPSPKSLDNYPFPARHLVQMDKYSLKIMGKRASTMMTSLGCPYHCSFCSEPILSNKFKARNPTLVVDEMEQLRNNYGIESLIIYDDVYTINPKRCIEIAEEMDRRKIKMCYRATTRANLILKPGLLRALKDSGCVELCLGVESGSDKILSTNDKGMTTKTNFDAIKEIQAAGIKVLIYMIIGLPGETPQTIQESLDFVDESNPDECSWYILAPFPSTPIWNFRDKLDIKIYEEEIIASDWDICQASKNNEELIPYVSTAACSREYLKDAWLKAMAKYSQKKSIQDAK